ncbi:MAG: rubrerythrin family protein [Candidatus Parcubacteria bacterium]|nr:rubrerythrin family protein [Candidatus Parcubacteria bacterium]
METEKNIQTAFAGECQAYRKYHLFAAKAEEEGLPEIAKLFREIAEEEVHHAAEHAELSGMIKSTKENLTAAINGERYESEEMYPEFAKTAKSEGNEKAAGRFSEIADDEKKHLKRYEDALNNLK